MTSRTWEGRRLSVECGAGRRARRGCGRGYEGGGELRARKKVLEREVAGLRDAVGRLERHEPCSRADLAVAIDDTLLQRVITAQLPFESDVDRFHLKPRGSRGALPRRAHREPARSPEARRASPDLEAVVNVIGALDDIAVEPSASPCGRRSRWTTSGSRRRPASSRC